MKKLTGMFVAAFAALAALGGQDNLLATFSTQGPDRYADGSVAKDGESYALVWSRTGFPFAGLTVEGKAVDTVNNAVLCIAPLAKDGHCDEVVVEVNKVLADAYAGAGTFSLQLLDTRLADGTVGGVASGVNGYGSAGAFTLAADAPTTQVATNAVLADTASVLPASIPQPRIKSIQVKDGKVILTVARTSRLVRYGVSSGATPNALAADADFAPANGDDAGDIVIEAPATGSSGFFTVGRAPLK